MTYPRKALDGKLPSPRHATPRHATPRPPDGTATSIGLDPAARFGTAYRGQKRKNAKQSFMESAMVIVARITTKGQTTIPQEIRAALQIGPGDLIAWELAGDGSARVQPLDLEYLRALEGTLSEWGRAADEEAYRDL